MVNQEETLEILNREREYEDKLVKDLNDYFLASLQYIEEIDEEKRSKINASLNHIRLESLKHLKAFEGLIDYVIKNGENNY
ncbi:MAG: hypothetical protein ACP5OG_05705 [Candidatus Nanoarchaeia archaeon]